MAPLARSDSTTCRLWTISRRTYTGGAQTDSASSTMSMARSTPAQKPRGPASRISAIGCVNARSSSEEVGQAEHGHVGLEPAVRLARVAVGDMLQPVPGVHRDMVVEEDRHPHAPEDQEGEGGPDLRQLEIRAAGRARDFDVRHDAAEPQEVVADDGREPGPEPVVRLGVPLIERLEPDLERAVERRVATDRIERKQAEPHSRV